MPFLSHRDFRSDLASIPGAVRSLLDRSSKEYAGVRGVTEGLRPDFVVVVGHGSSASAGRFLVHLLRSRLNLPAFAIGADELSDVATKFTGRNAVLVAISKSGATPDVVAAATAMKSAGHCVITITNRDDSALAQLARVALTLGGAHEECAAFSVSHLLTLVASALLVAHWKGDQTLLLDLESFAAGIGAVGPLHRLGDIEPILASRRALVLASGIFLSTAEEISVKFKEIFRVQAETCSLHAFWHAADSQVTEGYPVVLVQPGTTQMAIFHEFGARLAAIKPYVCRFALTSGNGLGFRVSPPNEELFTCIRSIMDFYESVPPFPDRAVSPTWF